MADNEHDFRFDLKVFASVTVSASSEAEARKKLAADLEHAQLSIGWHDGAPVCAVDASVDGDYELIEVDGEDVE